MSIRLICAINIVHTHSFNLESVWQKFNNFITKWYSNENIACVFFRLLNPSRKTLAIRVKNCWVKSLPVCLNCHLENQTKLNCTTNLINYNTVVRWLLWKIIERQVEFQRWNSWRRGLKTISVIKRLFWIQNLVEKFQMKPYGFSWIKSILFFFFYYLHILT